MASPYTNQNTGKNSNQRGNASNRDDGGRGSQQVSSSLPTADTLIEKAKSFLEGKEDPAKAIEYLKTNWKTVLGMVAVLGIQAYLAHSTNSSKATRQ